MVTIIISTELDTLRPGINNFSWPSNFLNLFNRWIIIHCLMSPRNRCLTCLNLIQRWALERDFPSILIDYWIKYWSWCKATKPNILSNAVKRTKTFIDEFLFFQEWIKHLGTAVIIWIGIGQELNRLFHFIQNFEYIIGVRFSVNQSTHILYVTFVVQ